MSDKVRVSARIAPGLKEKALECAGHTGETLSGFIRQAIASRVHNWQEPGTSKKMKQQKRSVLSPQQRRLMGWVECSRCRRGSSHCYWNKCKMPFKHAFDKIAVGWTPWMQDGKAVPEVLMHWKEQEDGSKVQVAEYWYELVGLSEEEVEQLLKEEFGDAKSN